MREKSVHTVRTTGVSPLLRTECTVLSRTRPPKSHLGLGLDQHLDASIIAPQTGDVQRSLSNAICNRWVDTALNEPLNLVWLVLLRLCPRHARISIALSEREGGHSSLVRRQQAGPPGKMRAGCLWVRTQRRPPISRLRCAGSCR